MGTRVQRSKVTERSSIYAGHTIHVRWRIAQRIVRDYPQVLEKRSPESSNAKLGRSRNICRFAEAPANSPQKLARPGFGPAAEPPFSAQA
jgi:hypothetical protein